MIFEPFGCKSALNSAVTFVESRVWIIFLHQKSTKNKSKQRFYKSYFGACLRQPDYFFESDS